MVDFYGKFVGKYTSPMGPTLSLYGIVILSMMMLDRWKKKKRISFGVKVQLILRGNKTHWIHGMIVYLPTVILLMEEIPNNHLGCIKPCK